MREWCLGQRVSHQSIHQRRLAPGPSSSVPHRRRRLLLRIRARIKRATSGKSILESCCRLFFQLERSTKSKIFVCSTTWKKWPKLLKWNFWNIVGFQGNYSSKQKGEGSPICGMFLPSIFFPFPHCLKITQNVSFEFLMLAFSTNFYPIKTDLSGNTGRPQASGFQKLAKMDHFGHF